MTQTTRTKIINILSTIFDIYIFIRYCCYYQIFQCRHASWKIYIFLILINLYIRWNIYAIVRISNRNAKLNYYSHKSNHELKFMQEFETSRSGGAGTPTTRSTLCSPRFLWCSLFYIFILLLIVYSITYWYHLINFI
jgi:hypothetical protein